MTQTTIGRDNPLPLYYQLKMQMMEQIATGELVEGQILPSEHMFMKTYGISRATIRQAFNELVNEGLLERKQGVGTFVAHKKIQPEINKLTSFSEDMLARGLQPGSMVLKVENLVPPSYVREGLGLAPDQSVWSVYRLRLGNNEPIGTQHLYIPPWITIDPADLLNLVSYYKLIEEKFGVKLARGKETLTAKNATQREAELLHTEPGRPLLTINRIAYDEQDRIIEYVEFVYRADRFQYQLSLYR